MSIEQLKADLKEVMAAAPSGALVTAEEVAAFQRNNLLPLLETMFDEVGEMDDTIEDLVHRSADVLHVESAAVFAGIIEGAALLVAELKTRVGDDRRLLKAIREWSELAKQGQELLEEITILDPEDDEEEGDEEPDEPAPTGPALASVPPDATPTGAE